MSVEDFVVLFCLFCCWAVRSKVFSLSFHVVAGPLKWGREDECLALCVMFAGGGTLASGNKGWVTPWTQRRFDCTMGFPGEDLFPQSRA